MSSVPVRSPHSYQTLVLNADGRPLKLWPLSLIPASDAVVAQLRDRIISVESWEGAYFRSESLSVPVPKVAMLRHYAPISGEPTFCRRSILLRDRYRCQYCGERFPSEALTFDHVIPRSKGGKTVWTNILTACLGCNGAKGSQDARHSGRKGVAGSFRPLKQPRRPTAAELLRAGLEFLPNEVRLNWGDFLYWGTELEP